MIVKRMASPLAEVKFVTGEIRKLIEGGASSEEIAVIAPEIEIYWPLLSFSFSEEGILSNKDLTCRLQSIPAVAWWISRIRLALSSFEYSDLESANYLMNPEVRIRFEKFEALYKKIIGSEDLDRNDEVRKAFSSSVSAEQNLSASEFLGFIAGFWHEGVLVEHLESVMREILKNTQHGMSFQLSAWFFWLEQIVSKMEMKVASGHRDGVQILNLSMADQSSLKYRFFIGLSENNFKPKKFSLISPKEVEKIYTDLGMHLSHQEQSQLEFEMRWLLSKKGSIDFLSFPMTDEKGQECSPHRIWMEAGGETHHVVDEPSLTRHDLLQLQDEGLQMKMRGVDSDEIPTRIRQIKKDLGLDETEDSFALMKGPSSFPSLSPSSLESYHHCAFKFAAEKIFGLLDPAEADLDSSYMTMGNLVHGLFEKLTLPPRRFDYSEAEISSMLEEIYTRISRQMKERGEFAGDPNFWPPLKNRILKIGQKFLEYEKSIQSELVEVVATEKKFSFEYEDIKWRGGIDRIDQIKGLGYVLYDYKSKNKDFEFKKWVTEKKLQLGFYAWALEKGFIEGLNPSMVAGAQYYIYKNFEKKGVDPTAPEAQKSLAEFYEKLETDMGVMKEALRAGLFPARPLDPEKTCQYCRWSQICRAQHLMT